MELIKKVYIVLLLFTSNLSLAQAPWVIEDTSNRFGAANAVNIYISSNNVAPYKAHQEVLYGAFYLNEQDEEVCVGFGNWDSTGIGIFDLYTPADPFFDPENRYYKFYLDDFNCTLALDSMDYFDPNAPLQGDTVFGMFATNIYLKVTDIDYLTDSTCQNTGDRIPEISVDIPITFTSPFTNSTTGAFDSDLAPIGSHSINYTSEYCIAGAPPTMQVLQPPDISIFIVQTLMCDTPGTYSVIINNVSSDYSIYWSTTQDTGVSTTITEPTTLGVSVSINSTLCHAFDSLEVLPREDTFELSHNYLGEIIPQRCNINGSVSLDTNSSSDLISRLIEFPNQDISNLTAGSYNLFFQDTLTSCKYGFRAVNIDRIDCEELAYYPESETDFHVETPGTTKLYDRNGVLLLEAESPFDWDGTDEAGNHLPSGIYFIVTNESESLSVTLIR